MAQGLAASEVRQFGTRYFQSAFNRDAGDVAGGEVVGAALRLGDPQFFRHRPIDLRKLLRRELSRPDFAPSFRLHFSVARAAFRHRRGAPVKEYTGNAGAGEAVDSQTIGLCAIFRLWGARGARRDGVREQVWP